LLQKNKRSLSFRFNKSTPRHLPLTVRSVGHYRFPTSCLINSPAIKWFCQLFWITAGCGEIRLGNKAFRVTDGDLFFYLPGECHDLRHLGLPWSYRWITFDHAEAPRWLESFGLNQRPFPAGPCPARLFEQATRALHLGTPRGDRAAAHQAHAIFLAILERDAAPPVSDSSVNRCKHRMDNGFSNPALTVEAIAAEFSMHRSTLFRLFLKNYEVTPSRYLHNLRIRQALVLLQDRNLQIQEVAWRSGFADPNYFSRAIREVTGMRPHEFRTV
jgi:AraC family transcriptional regulator of arabinose operon